MCTLWLCLLDVSFSFPFYFYFSMSIFSRTAWMRRFWGFERTFARKFRIILTMECARPIVSLTLSFSEWLVFFSSSDSNELRIIVCMHLVLWKLISAKNDNLSARMRLLHCHHVSRFTKQNAKWTHKCYKIRSIHIYWISKGLRKPFCVCVCSCAKAQNAIYWVNE